MNIVVERSAISLRSTVVLDGASCHNGQRRQMLQKLVTAEIEGEQIHPERIASKLLGQHLDLTLTGYQSLVSFRRSRRLSLLQKTSEHQNFRTLEGSRNQFNR